ncbi:alpha/beta hydrolase [Salibacterium halotolerans]|uniref:Alpha/beta hydrolase fold n=1 Tax=Salibacterium halotolerans TaxID=1884432 RepID=A0A1I5QTB7_9BACI|nr:alpha/beta hydrolase [Salibacterium halotolerans]SFP49463.1 alpha/beta hydrolase fold [Salibacterium halotolerans]
MEHKKIRIWGSRIPYNTGKNKFEELDVQKKRPRLLRTFHCMRTLGSRTFTEKHHYIHEMTYHEEIKNGEGIITYDDIPYLTEYTVSGSDRAMIIVPGGGYIFKSFKQEGEGMARALNEAGISAFVLWYRLNSYKDPVPSLDLQRALRYVKYHAREYGIHPEKVGVLGFSAGGHCVASVLTKHTNAAVNEKGYEEDEVDQMDGRPALAGLIYPVLTIRDIPNMLVALHPKEELDDEEKWEKLLHGHELSQYIQSGDPPQFLCYGTKDLLISQESVQQYQRTLEEKGVPNHLLELEGAHHGFGDCEGTGLKRLNNKFSYWKKHFINWANEVFDAIETGTE